MSFPIDLGSFRQQSFSLDSPISVSDLEILLHNIQLVRDTIVFYTSLAAKRGYGGHTGGAYDMAPEALILTGFMNNRDNMIYPVLFDEAGHRVALQYLFAVLYGYMDAQRLLHYREFESGLYGHPEREVRDGIFFSSGRLGHMWSFVNGIAEAHPHQKIVILGSDGSQMEGNDAEASRYCVARNLDVHMFVDNNNVTISGHPAEYMKGFSVEKTLAGHGLTVETCDGNNIPLLYEKIRHNLNQGGPTALVSDRIMAEGIPEIEGTSKAHDAVPPDSARRYLVARGHDEAVAYLDSAEKGSNPYTFRGSSGNWSKVRSDFGKQIGKQIRSIPEERRKDSVLVIDSDLEGSCGLSNVRKMAPEVLVSGGVMERNNFSVAAGFGSSEGRQGIFATFSAFAEMIISELSMARLNDANVLAHFSHAGVDEMADNTCHFGINNFFLDNALAEKDTTRMYFPADVHQLAAIIPQVFHEDGIRFIFSTRSAVPEILAEDGSLFFKEGYRFDGSDEIIRDGKRIVIVSFGEMLYRSLDAVEKLRDSGLESGLVNKPLLNIPDKEMMHRLASAEVVLVVESFNMKTGLGIRFGTWLLQFGFKGVYDHIGSVRPGQGGLYEQVPHQGLGPDNIMNRVRELARRAGIS